MLKQVICDNNYKTKRVVDFFSHISWKSFSTNQIYIMLSSDSHNFLFRDNFNDNKFGSLYTTNYLLKRLRKNGELHGGEYRYYVNKTEYLVFLKWVILGLFQRIAKSLTIKGNITSLQRNKMNLLCEKD